MLKWLFIAVALSAAAPAQAQIKAEHPRYCVMSVGPAQMMFSAFQENKTDEIFCHHIPTIGPTMIILDATSNELRDMTVELRLIKDIGQKDWRDDLDATTVAAFPPGKYLETRGTASFTYDFKGDGDYIAVVRATSGDNAKEYVGQYRFTVGAAFEEAVLMGSLAFLVGVVGVLAWRRRANAPRPAPAPSTARPSAM